MTQLSGSAQTIEQKQSTQRRPSAPADLPLKNGQFLKNGNGRGEQEVCEIKKTIVTSPATPPSSVIEEIPQNDVMKDPKIQSAVTNNNNYHHNNNNNSTMVPLPQVPRHREMAVDVPDTFVAVTKTAPRYPPPRKKPPNTPETSSLKKNGLYRFSTESSSGIGNHVRSMSSQDGNTDAGSEKRTPPTPRISEVMLRTKGDVSRTSSKRESVNSEVVELDEHMDRIRKYQEDIRKRKEDEERQAREEEFLRSSLRGSKKLRALEKEKSGNPGLENTGFQLEELDAGATLTSDVDGKLVSEKPEGEPPELTGTYEPSVLLEMLHNVETLLTKTGFSESLVDLEKLFHNEEFQTLLTLHNKVQELCCFKCLPSPVCTDAQVISLEIMRALQDAPSKDAKELLHILGKHQFENLMFCHDKIGASQVIPELTEEEELLTKVSEYTEDSIKVVRIEKTSEPLGATVRNEGEAVIIGRIVKGGVAEKTGLLHEGDEILAVNGLELRGSSVNDVCDIMASLSGVLTFFIVPGECESPKPQTRETVCGYFGTIGGFTIKDTMRRVLQTFITNPLSQLYNWKGTGGVKLAFCQLTNVVKFVEVSVRKHSSFRHTTTQEVETIITKWLMHARDRDGGRAKRTHKLLI